MFQDQISAGVGGLRLLRFEELTPTEGGPPLVVDGKIVGSFGISGGASEQDSQVAAAGVVTLK